MYCKRRCGTSDPDMVDVTVQIQVDHLMEHFSGDAGMICVMPGCSLCPEFSILSTGTGPSHSGTRP